MDHTAGKFIAVVLMIGLLGLPAGLSAKTKKGAAIIVIRLDGNQAKGELVAVKPEALILHRGGTDLTIPRVKIHSVQVLRRSKRGTGTLVGFLAGASAGFIAGLCYGDRNVHGMETPLKAGEFFGGLGALIGLCVSHGGGVDSTLVLTGSSTLASDEIWDRLRAYSREARGAKRLDAPEP